jgi:hypothetical protein
MLPQFEGIDDWVPRPYRETLVTAVTDGTIQIERLLLCDRPTISDLAMKHIAQRWAPASPLRRAALAVTGYWEERGVDVGKAHLHGSDVRDAETPYFAGFGWRYFRSIPLCLTEYGGDRVARSRPSHKDPSAGLPPHCPPRQGEAVSSVMGLNTLQTLLGYP